MFSEWSSPEEGAKPKKKRRAVAFSMWPAGTSSVMALTPSTCALSPQEVAAGTALLHFIDKKGLLHAALHDDLQRAIAASLNAAHRGGLPARLCAVVLPFFGYYAARPSLSKTLLRESLLAAPPWQQRFSDQAKKVHAHVASMAEEAKAGGEISRDINAKVFTAAVISFYYFALIGWVQGAIEDPMPLFKRLLKQQVDRAAVTKRE